MFCRSYYFILFMTNKKIRRSVRQKVWNTYIGDHIGKTKCLLCEQNDISAFQFHCVHVIAQSKNGTSAVTNLRPLCSVCTQSVSGYNLIEFARKFHPQSRIHQTFFQMEENHNDLEQLGNCQGPSQDQFTNRDNRHRQMKSRSPKTRQDIQAYEPKNNLNDSLMIQLLLNQQKQITSLQKQIEEDQLNNKKLEKILLEIKDKYYM